MRDGGPGVDTPAADRTSVSAHYARRGLVAAIRDAVAHAGKTTSTVTLDDLAPVDEFHIGGREATRELMDQLAPAATDHLLDIGCGLGGAARFVATRYGCRVTGIDLTRDYVEAGNVLCEWTGSAERVSLHHADALWLPCQDGVFSGAYLLHAGMNIRDKDKLFSEVARVVHAGAGFGVYDVMRIGDGDLGYPLPWASSGEANAIAGPEQYRSALRAAGFEIVAERNRRDFALAYFDRMRSQTSTDAPFSLGLHTLMGDRRPAQVRNMIEALSNGLIAPIEMIARRT